MLRGLTRLVFLGAVVHDCGQSGDTATFLNGTFSPEQPVPGDLVTVTFAYSLSKAITGGTAKYSLSLNGIPYTLSNDLCTQTSCPKDPGDHLENSTSTFPQISGKLATKIQWFDQDSLEVLCVDYTVRTVRTEL